MAVTAGQKKWRERVLRRLVWAAALVLCLCAGMPAKAESVPLDERKIKAGILYNYLKYTAWPPRDTEAAYLSVCLYGGDPFRGALDTFEGRTAQQYTIRVLHTRTMAEVKTCDVLFIDKSAEDQLPDIFAATRGNGVLTMSDIENFALRGGMVGFSMQASHIHVIVNKAVVEKDNIRIEPRMLKMGDVVNQ